MTRLESFRFAVLLPSGVICCSVFPKTKGICVKLVKNLRLDSYPYFGEMVDTNGCWCSVEFWRIPAI